MPLFDAIPTFPALGGRPLLRRTLYIVCTISWLEIYTVDEVLVPPTGTYIEA